MMPNHVPQFFNGQGNFPHAIYRLENVWANVLKGQGQLPSEPVPGAFGKFLKLHAVLNFTITPCGFGSRCCCTKRQFKW